MWELDYKEIWALKNWCFWTVVLEKTFESPWDCKEIQPVHPKGNQSWVFIGRTDAEAETLILWPPDAKSWLIWKHSDAGRDWGQEEKGMTEDEMERWHHRLNGHGFGWTLGVGDGQGGLACCGSCMGSQSQTWLSDWIELIGSYVSGRDVEFNIELMLFFWHIFALCQLFTQKAQKAKFSVFAKLTHLPHQNIFERTQYTFLRKNWSGHCRKQ